MSRYSTNGNGNGNGPARLAQPVTELLEPLADDRAEGCVLGSMMLDAGAARLGATLLAPEDFYNPLHAAIFGALCELGEDADDYLIEQLMTARGQAGLLPDGYLAELMNAVPTGLNVRGYAGVVADRAERRRILGALSGIARRAHDLTGDAREVYDAAIEMFAGAASARNAAGQAMDDIAVEALVMFDERIQTAGALLGYPSGVTALDRITQGWQRGTLNVIAGRPGTGKSALMIQSTLRAGLAGANVRHYTLEMSGRQTLARMAKNHMQLGVGQNREHLMSEADRARFRAGVGQIAALPITLSGVDSIQSIIAECEIAKRRGKLDMVVVDYLQIAVPDVGRRDGGTRDAELSAATRALKQMARRLDVPVLIGSQLNRLAEGVCPALSMLRESGGIESDSDVIVMLWIPDRDGQPNVLEASVAKNREGDTGAARMYFKKDMQRMGDVVAVPQ